MGVYVRSFQDLIRKWDIIEEDARKKNQIFAFLFCTSWDKGPMSYIEKYSTEIGAMSGTGCKIFMIINPPEKYVNVEKYQKWVEAFACEREVNVKDIEAGMKITAIYHNSDRFKQNRSTDFNPDKAYEVAEALDVPKNSFPCIVFFKNVDDRERIIYPIPRHVHEKDKALDKDLEGVILERLRDLFAAIDLTRDDKERIASERQRDERWNKLKKHVEQTIEADKRTKRYEWFKREAKSLGEIFRFFPITLLPMCGTRSCRNL